MYRQVPSWHDWLAGSQVVCRGAAGDGAPRALCRRRPRPPPSGRPALPATATRRRPQVLQLLASGRSSRARRQGAGGGAVAAAAGAPVAASCPDCPPAVGSEPLPGSGSSRAGSGSSTRPCPRLLVAGCRDHLHLAGDKAAQAGQVVRHFPLWVKLSRGIRARLRLRRLLLLLLLRRRMLLLLLLLQRPGAPVRRHNQVTPRWRGGPDRAAGALQPAQLLSRSIRLPPAGEGAGVGGEPRERAAQPAVRPHAGRRPCPPPHLQQPEPSTPPANTHPSSISTPPPPPKAPHLSRVSAWRSCSACWPASLACCPACRVACCSCSACWVASRFACRSSALSACSAKSAQPRTREQQLERLTLGCWLG